MRSVKGVLDLGQFGMDISAYVWNEMSNFPLYGIPYEYDPLNTDTETHQFYGDWD